MLNEEEGFSYCGSIGSHRKLMRDRVFNPFRRPYLWLLVFSLSLGAVVTISEFRPTLLSFHPQLEQALMMLSVGTFSSYLTAVLVDGTFRQKEERDRNQLQNTALTELRNPLNRYLKLIRVWYRCALKEPPESPPDSLKTIIESEEIEKVRLLDFSQTYPVVGRSRRYTFLTDSAETIEQFQSEIDEVLQKYSIFLEPELVESLQSLKNSDLFQLLISFEKYGIAIETDMQPLFAGVGYLDFQENLGDLLDIVEYYEEPGSPELTLLDISYMWRDDERPKIGSARVDASLECIQQIELSEEPPNQVLSDDIIEVIEKCDNG